MPSAVTCPACRLRYLDSRDCPRCAATRGQRAVEGDASGVSPATLEEARRRILVFGADPEDVIAALVAQGAPPDELRTHVSAIARERRGIHARQARFKGMVHVAVGGPATLALGVFCYYGVQTRVGIPSVGLILCIGAAVTTVRGVWMLLTGDAKDKAF